MIDAVIDNLIVACFRKYFYFPYNFEIQSYLDLTQIRIVEVESQLLEVSKKCKKYPILFSAIFCVFYYTVRFLACD